MRRKKRFLLIFVCIKLKSLQEVQEFIVVVQKVFINFAVDKILVGMLENI